jgi:hypothetical protein
LPPHRFRTGHTAWQISKSAVLRQSRRQAIQLKHCAGGRGNQTCLMSQSVLLFMAGIFLLAGFVKGVVGLGLPVIAMGLLALFMPPADAASILIL